MSINELIKRAVDGFKRGTSIEFDPKLINRDSQVLTNGAYDTDSFLDDSDLICLLAEDQIFISSMMPTISAIIWILKN